MCFSFCEWFSITSSNNCQKGWHRFIALRMVKGLINLAVFPKMVKQHGQLSGHRNDGTLFGILPTAFGKLEAPTSKIAVRSEWPEDVLGG